MPVHEVLGAGDMHPPRILLLYGSLRPQSFSRKLALEAERILQHLGAETRVFDPHDLPVLDSVDKSHPKVQQLREWSQWSEGQVWVSPERHGTITAGLSMRCRNGRLDAPLRRSAAQLCRSRITGAAQHERPQNGHERRPITTKATRRRPKLLIHMVGPPGLEPGTKGL